MDPVQAQKVDKNVEKAKKEEIQAMLRLAQADAAGQAAPTDRSSGRVAETVNVEASSDRQRERDPLNNAGPSSGPRIFYQNNDPEFDDLDEEEGLDNDLDL